MQPDEGSVATLHSRIESWECDYNGHWNARFYGRSLQLAAEGIATASRGAKPGRDHASDAAYALSERVARWRRSRALARRNTAKRHRRASPRRRPIDASFTGGVDGDEICRGNRTRETRGVELRRRGYAIALIEQTLLVVDLKSRRAVEIPDASAPSPSRPNEPASTQLRHRPGKSKNLSRGPHASDVDMFSSVDRRGAAGRLCRVERGDHALVECDLLRRRRLGGVDDAHFRGMQRQFSARAELPIPTRGFGEAFEIAHLLPDAADRHLACNTPPSPSAISDSAVAVPPPTRRSPTRARRRLSSRWRRRWPKPAGEPRFHRRISAPWRSPEADSGERRRSRRRCAIPPPQSSTTPYRRPRSRRVWR